MKRIFLVLAGILLLYTASAQKSLLAQDENNKYIYYQVVDQPNATKDSLVGKVNSFLHEAFKKSKRIQTGDSLFTVKDKFLTYSAFTFAKHESGEVDFVLNIECKDNKYRYWLTDFVFRPYYKDRYGMFVPENGIEIPLEKASSKLDKKDLEGYLAQTGAYCRQTGDNLKAFMIQNHQFSKANTQPARRVVTKKW
ncbi:MAG: DUF4468 domain-containing protein [Bacteroidetes bacterium]|nr:DUF4468 domain-containing protein [Bacteroidota bacterium]